MPAQDPNWPEALLRRLGRLFLLIQGFKQLDQLDPAVQADLQTAVGWLSREMTSDPDMERHDQWHVVGQQVEQSGRRQIQQIWLWGEQSNKPAQIIQVTHGRRHVDHSLVVGAVLEARLRYFASAAPLRAQILERYRMTQPRRPVAGFASNQAAMTAYSQTLALNPWLRRFPVASDALIPTFDGQRWLLQDEEGHILPLPTRFKHGWHLRALSGGGLIFLFGEWDGRQLTPFSVWSDGRYLPLHILRGVQ